MVDTVVQNRVETVEVVKPVVAACLVETVPSAWGNLS